MKFSERIKLSNEYRDWLLKENKFEITFSPESFLAFLEIKGYEINKNKRNIDDFVTYLIKENCEGCTECSPTLESNDIICVEESRAKWFISMAEKYKKGEDK